MQAPAAAAASRMARAEGVSTERGFSQYTALPASSAARAISAWSAFGAVIATTSISGSSASRRQSPVDRSNPSAAADRRAAASSMSARHRSFGSTGRSNSPPTERNAFAWHLPMNPAPMSPIRAAGFALPSAMMQPLVAAVSRSGLAAAVEYRAATADAAARRLRTAESRAPRPAPPTSTVDVGGTVLFHTSVRAGAV